MQIVAFAILGLIFIVVGFILQFVLPQIKFVGWAIMALGTILLASSFILEFRRVRKALASHRGKFSTSTSIMVCVFVGIILLVNAVSSNFYKTFDLTGLSQFTLTSQTQEVLRDLNMPVEAICFFVPNVSNVDSSYTTMYSTARQFAPALLAEYSNYTTKLNITIVDPEQHPEIAREYGINSEYFYQSVIFKTTLGWKGVYAPSIASEGENAFTSAILQVTGVKQKTVYFLSGHGEANPLDNTDNGYGAVRQALLDNLYLVNTLDLQATPAIPADCAVLVVAGPKTKMSDSERKIISDYLDYGGKAIFLSDPGGPDDIAQIGALWGIVVKSGTIIDPTSYAAPNIDSPSFDRYSNYYGLTSLYFPGLTDVEPAQYIPQGMAVSALLVTSKDAWMTNDYNPSVTPVYNATKDFKTDNGLIGGIYIGPNTSSSTTSATDTTPVGTEIMFVGDSDFANDKNFGNGDNGQFLLDMIAQLTANTKLISIDSKLVQTHKLVISPEQSRFLNISSIGLLPALVLIMGIVVWWRRR